MTMYLIKRQSIPPNKVAVIVLNGNKHDDLVSVGSHGDQFEYGFHGSGPATLAWSILADYLQESDLTSIEVRSGNFVSGWLHQIFKEEVIAKLDGAEDAHWIRDTLVKTFVSRYIQDIEEYKKKREEFRDASRLADQFEDKYGRLNTVPDELLAEWHVLSKIINSYLDWFDFIRLPNQEKRGNE